MQFRILGPLEVEDGHRAISFDAPKQRTLLAVLLLHPNEVVSSERLIDELWGERPPATANKVVQTYVSQLRKALGPGTIVTRPPGYTLQVEEGALDAERFRRLTSEGQATMAAGKPERADELYRKALALWRGPPLADVVFESFAANEVEGLDEARLKTLMDRIDCELALGRHHELVSELETLVGQYPLRERPRAQLMLALYRSGQQADALAEYQSARRTLVDELGLEPSGELQALERAILTHDADLAPPAKPARELIPRRRPGWRAVALAISIAVVLVAGLAFALNGRQPAKRLLPPDSVGFIDARSARVTTVYPGLGGVPSSLTVANGLVWIALSQNGIVLRLDPVTRNRRPISIGGLHPLSLAAAHGKVFVWTAERRLVTIDERSYVASEPLNLGARAERALLPNPGITPGVPARGRITEGGGFLWITVPPTIVLRLRPTDPAHTFVIHPNDTVRSAIAFGNGQAWVGGYSQVFPIEKTGFSRVGTEVGGVRDLAFGAGAVWVVSGTDVNQSLPQALRRVNPVGPVVDQKIDVRDPVAVTWERGSVWVASSTDRTVEEVDPAEEKVVKRIPLGSPPTALTPDDREEGVWVGVE